MTGAEQLDQSILDDIIFNKNLIAFMAGLVPKYPQAFDIIKILQADMKADLKLLTQRKRERKQNRWAGGTGLGSESGN